MTIFLKNKHTLQIDDFYFKCCIGKNGITKRKKEGDYKTPSGNFAIEELFFRKDKIEAVIVMAAGFSNEVCKTIKSFNKKTSVVKLENNRLIKF